MAAPSSSSMNPRSTFSYPASFSAHGDTPRLSSINNSPASLQLALPATRIHSRIPRFDEAQQLPPTMAPLHTIESIVGGHFPTSCGAAKTQDATRTGSAHPITAGWPSRAGHRSLGQSLVICLHRVRGGVATRTLASKQPISPNRLGMTLARCSFRGGMEGECSIAFDEAAVLLLP